MNSMLMASVKVSLLALGVIFLVLGILIVIIKLMTHFIPYKAPPAPTAKPGAPGPSTSSLEDEDHIAAIQAVVAHHAGRSGKVQILNIQSK